MAVQPAARAPCALQRHRQPARQPNVRYPPARRSPLIDVLTLPARSKAVADGAIGFYCDHHVSARMSKFMYGVEYLREFDSKDDEHVARKHRLFELPSGPKLLPDAFDCILNRVRAWFRPWSATLLTRSVVLGRACEGVDGVQPQVLHGGHQLVDSVCVRGGDLVLPRRWIRAKVDPTQRRFVGVVSLRRQSSNEIMVCRQLLDAVLCACGPLPAGGKRAVEARQEREDVLDYRLQY